MVMVKDKALCCIGNRRPYDILIWKTFECSHGNDKEQSFVLTGNICPSANLIRRACGEPRESLANLAMRSLTRVFLAPVSKRVDLRRARRRKLYLKSLFSL